MFIDRCIRSDRSSVGAKYEVTIVSYFAPGALPRAITFRSFGASIRPYETAGCCAAALSGNDRINRLPFPGVLSTAISPPCAWVM